METTEKNVEVLNDLVKINNDRVEGYERAIKETKDLDGDLRDKFRNMADDSRKYASELNEIVTSKGERPVEGTTMPGKIYRAWMDVKTAVSGSSRASILSACERGEDAAQNAYDNALKEDQISSSVRDIIARQKEALKSSHDVIKQWRDNEKAKK